MATIKSQLTLNDGMSTMLKKITQALDITLASFEQVQRASGSAIDTGQIETARGLLVEVSNDFERMGKECEKAAKQEEKLNKSIQNGASAADTMLNKITSIAGAYAGISNIKGFAASSMEAANTQINAQVQLRTVLENMGAVDSYEALASTVDGTELDNTLELATAGAMRDYNTLTNKVDGTELGNTLDLDTVGALDNYASVVDDVGNNALENTLTLDTAEAMDKYDTFAADIIGNTLEVGLVVQADNSGALTAYDAIVDKAAEIQGRGIYGDEAMIAGAAEFATYFEDANAVMSMMDTLTDYAMGMSGGGALDTTAMVDYATNLGKIMSGSYDAMNEKGFKFTDVQKAIIEGTATESQIAAELGAEYLNMSSDMQAAATINNVIAEGWGGLYETMSNTPEGKLIQLNNTLGDIKENVGAGIYPAVLELVGVIQENMPAIQGGAMTIAAVISSVINLITQIAQFLAPIASDVGSIQGKFAELLPVVGAAVAFAALLGLKMMASAMMSAASWGMAHLPLLLLTAVIVGVIGYAMQMGATFQQVCGYIGGMFGVLLITLYNTFIVPFWNAFAMIANFVANVFNDPVAAVTVAFYDMALTVVGYIRSMADSIETLLNKIPGVTIDITSGLDSFYSSLEAAQQKVKDESEWVEVVSKLDYKDAGSAWDAGYDFGVGLGETLEGLFDTNSLGSLDDLMNQIPDMPGTGGLDSFAMDDLGNDVGAIADNTGGMADALEISGEELKYLRDIAERDAINRFTTAEVRIDMTGMTNKIDGGADLDGVIRELTDGFTEALLTAAEGVHT